MASITIDVGRLLCGDVRKFLESCKFKGMDIEWHESKGWISRVFTIKGNNDDILSINKALEKWVD